jgi:hypothetical protein
MRSEAQLEEAWLALRRRDVDSARRIVAAIPVLEGENDARRIALHQACESLALGARYSTAEIPADLNISHTTRRRIQMIEEEFNLA